MLPRLNGHFIAHDEELLLQRLASVLSFHVIFLDFGQQLLVCVDGIIQDKATE